MPLIPTEEAATQLAALVAGLLFVSEVDHPMTVVRVLCTGELDAPSLLRALGKPSGLVVERRSLQDFFARAVEDQPWHGPSERATVRRYRDLLRFLQAALDGAQVFRVGVIEIEAYALGKTADGEWLGVATKQVET